MFASYHALLSGDLDPSRTHFWLLLGAIACEFAVAAGIILESPKEKDCRERIGMLLVLGGVTVSVIFTVALFLFDEGISGKQQTKIIALETRLEKASQDLVSFGKQNLRLKNALLPRKIMDGNQYLHWLEELSKAPQNFAVIEVVPDLEAAALAREIKLILERFGHWRVEFITNYPQPYIDEGVTLITYNTAKIDADHPPTMGPSLSAL